MGVPKELTEEGFAKVGEYKGTEVQDAVPFKMAKHAGKNLIDRTFFAYLETGMQSKHDVTFRGKKGSRKEDGSQVVYKGKQTPNEFYKARGLVACGRVKARLEEVFTENGGINNSIFIKGKKTILAVQKETQDDGYKYDINCYYEGKEVYVSFHCYPA